MYTKRFINFSALIISTVICLLVNFFINIKLDINCGQLSEDNVEIITEETTMEAENLENNAIQENFEKTEWKIKIPQISLEAPIAEGTEAAILNEYVGHFTETQKFKGNVGLAAHNRGYSVNYFARLKELKEGDEIIYILGQNEKKYKVIKNIQISDIDWSYLENTEENKITLITCIENKPEYRRCVQAIEE